jgi:hypothetical protein
MKNTFKSVCETVKKFKGKTGKEKTNQISQSICSSYPVYVSET